jgi:hypothetical protein
MTSYSKNPPPPMSPAEPITDHGLMLQVLVVTCDGVEYMFFGPPVWSPDDDVPNVESIAFAGYMPASQMVELLKNANKPDPTNKKVQ